MMTGRNTRIRIDEDGCLELVDPGLDSLDLLQSIDPGFQVRCSELPGFTSPRILQSQRSGCGIAIRELDELSEEKLWGIHRSIMQELRTGRSRSIHVHEASLVDLKVELSRRMLLNCQLCAHRCGVDRIHGERGACLLGTEANIAEPFIHIAEEPPINPSLLISLAGCGMRCRYCQQWELLDPGMVNGVPLKASLWDDLDMEGARSISFIGGNPDESLYAVLQFMASVPSDWRLPIVWNCHGYGTPETVELLDGVVDAYVPDFKYGNDYCGRRLSNAPGYPAAAEMAITNMLTQEVPVIVRILVLPGHFQCCHVPVLRFLSSVNNERLLISVRDQYWPDWKTTAKDDQMNRRATQEEVESVRQLACNLGLKLVQDIL